MSLEETADTLVRLFSDGDIVARDSLKLHAKRTDGHRRELPRVPDRDEVLDALIDRNSAESDFKLCYWLTTQGGDRWAAHARADWDRYFANDYELDEDFDNGSPAISGEPIGTITLRTTNRARIDFLVDTVWRWWWPSHDRFGDSVAISEITPWQATYWKQLPHAYQAQFPIRWFDRNVEEAPQRVLDLINGMSDEEIAAWSDREEHEVRHWHEGYLGD